MVFPLTFDFYQFTYPFLLFNTGDKTLRLYSLPSFQELQYSPVSVFKYGVNFTTFDRCGNLLATADSDGKAHVFKVTPEAAQVYVLLNLKMHNQFHPCFCRYR